MHEKICRDTSTFVQSRLAVKFNIAGTNLITICIMVVGMDGNLASVGNKWYEKYLPFVAKSPDIQAEWLAAKLSRLRLCEGGGKSGVLSKDEIKPYIRLLLDNISADSASVGAGSNDGQLVVLLDGMGEGNLLLMIECAEVYDLPKIFSLLRHPSLAMAVVAMKKVPPPYEKNPLLIIDRVFHAIREKSAMLLEEAAVVVLADRDAPVDFSVNYDRFKEIMMDEHLLSILYPKAK